MNDESIADNGRRLKIERPLVSFDLETTGLSIQDDRIVEISCVKIFPDGSEEIKTRRLNPTIPISEEATAVHGITDAEVHDLPTFAQIARGLCEYLKDCDLTGFNLRSFDLPMLGKEFERAGIRFPTPSVRVIDSRRIYLAKEPRTLAAAYQHYCGQELDQAHSAEADARAAAAILIAQIDLYSDLPNEVDGLHAFCHPVQPDWIDSEGKLLWKGDAAVLGFGKYRHRTLQDVVKKDAEYLQWVATSNFSEEVASIVKKALDGDFPQPPTQTDPAPPTVNLQATG